MTSSQAQPAQRQHWTRPRDFLWASLSYTLGLGTIWRLPFLFYKHGGAAFLLPYFACILLLGFPLLTAEVAVGQAFQSGSATAWALLKPFAGGLGPAMLTLAFIINIYYIVVIAWAGLYLLLSLGTWTSGLSLMAGRSCAFVWDNASCTENYQDAISNRSLKTSDEAFFRQRILGFEAGGDPEDYQPFLVVTLLLSWMFVFAILVKGSRSMRFGNLLTGVLPPVTMVILSLMAVFFLPGSFTGISDYLTPKLGALVTVAAWRDAATQVLFSYGVGLGALTALGSYSKAGSAKSGAQFSRHLKMLVGVHTLVGLITVLGFYALAGHFQLVEGVAPLEKHFRTTGAIFVLIPRTLATLSNSHLWTSLFYGLVFFLGLGSQAMTVEGVVLAIEDALHFNTTRAFSFKKRVGMLSFMTLISFGLGLCLVKRKGLLTFDVFDSFGAPVWSLNNFLILECILFACFGLAAVEQRLPGLTFGPLSRSVLLYVTPTLLVLLQLFETFKFLDFIKSSLSSCKLGLGMSLLLAPYIVGLGIVVLYMVHRRVDDAKMTKDDLKKKMAFV